MRYPTMSGADMAGIYGASAASAAVEENKQEPVNASQP